MNNIFNSLKDIVKLWLAIDVDLITTEYPHSHQETSEISQERRYKPYYVKTDAGKLINIV